MPHASFFLRLGAGLLWTGVCGQALAQAIPADARQVQHLGMNAAYVRETRDQAWHIRITDSLPIFPGLYVIVYNERGDIGFHGEVPRGDYTPEAPFALTVPADGVAQQYVIKFLGAPPNIAAITLPVTDLPFEVYGGSDHHGGTLFAMPNVGRGEILRLAFQVRPGVNSISVLALGGMRILDGSGKELVRNSAAPNRTPDPSGKKAPQAEVALDLKTQAGQTYWIDPMTSWKVETPKDAEKIYLTLDPSRWFSPTITWDLDSRPWWKGLFKE